MALLRTFTWLEVIVTLRAVVNQCIPPHLHAVLGKLGLGQVVLSLKPVGFGRVDTFCLSGNRSQSSATLLVAGKCSLLLRRIALPL
jgi:hypothetical protein